MRNKESVFLEFEQLLNLLFPKNSSGNPSRWSQAPFTSALEGFCREALLIVPGNELRDFANDQWLARSPLASRPEVRDSVYKMLEAALPSRN